MVEGLPEGFVARPVTVAEAALVAGLMAESSRAVIGEDDVTVDEVRERLERSGFDPARDAVLVLDSEQSPVGYSDAFDEHPEQAEIDVYVSPALPDADFHRLGAWLTERVLRRVEEFVNESGRAGIRTGTGCYRSEARLANVLQAAGLVHNRVFWWMRVELDDRHLSVEPPPASLTIRAVDESKRAELELLHRLETESFREHFETVEFSFEQFCEHVLMSVYVDPSLWWVAEVDGKPAGFLMGDGRRRELGGGWVRSVGVLMEFRGRGVARALLTHSFAEFRRRGLTHVMLGVDSENTTGATRLYESVGLKPQTVIDSYSITLPR